MTKRPYINYRKKKILEIYAENEDNYQVVSDIYKEFLHRKHVSEETKDEVWNNLISLIQEEPRNDHSFPTITEVQRGIYIDFEGVKRDRIDDKVFDPAPPSIIGILIEDDFQQINLDQKLALAANHEGLVTRDLADVIAEILFRANQQSRYVFAYSEHELNIIYVFTYLGKNIGRVYQNGRALASRWKNRFGHADEILNNSLKSFAEYIGLGYERESKPATWIRYIRKRMKSKEDFCQVSKKGRAYWKTLLAYNEKDCVVLKELMMKAAEEFAEKT
jgi:predicted RecB family nuclease